MKGLETTIGMFIVVGAGTYSFITGVNMLASNQYVNTESPELLIAVGALLMIAPTLLCVIRGRMM